MKHSLLRLFPPGAGRQALLLWLFVLGGSEAMPSLATTSSTAPTGTGDCEAEAGLLEAVETGCIASTLQLEATVSIEPVVPHGYELIYVLTAGNDLIIEAASESPEFVASTDQNYSPPTPNL